VAADPTAPPASGLGAAEGVKAAGGPPAGATVRAPGKAGPRPTREAGSAGASKAPWTGRRPAGPPAALAGGPGAGRGAAAVTP